MECVEQKHTEGMSKPQSWYCAYASGLVDWIKRKTESHYQAEIVAKLPPLLGIFRDKVVLQLVQDPLEYTANVNKLQRTTDEIRTVLEADLSPIELDKVEKMQYGAQIQKITEVEKKLYHLLKDLLEKYTVVFRVVRDLQYKDEEERKMFAPNVEKVTDMFLFLKKNVF